MCASVETANNRPASPEELSVGSILRFWLPLALSSLLISLGMPIINAFVARMPQAELQLGALGIAFSLTLAAESPVIALLTTAVALCKDRSSYRRLLAFTVGLSILVTSIMLVVGLTPVFDWLVVGVIGTPLQIARRVRPALIALTPFPAAVAYRRFLQGVMIRCGHTDPVGYGTVIRLLVTTVLSGLGMVWGALEGATVGGLSLGAALVVEATYIHLASRSSIKEIKANPLSSLNDRLTFRKLLHFYWPLGFTGVIWLCAPSLISFALANAAHSMQSLAIWPVVNGQVSLVSSFGFSFLDVVVAQLDSPRSAKHLRLFAVVLGAGSLLLLSVVAFTPLAPWWLQRVAGLDDHLIALAVSTLRLAFLLPAVAVALSWLRALIAKADATTAMAHAAIVNLTLLTALLVLGVTGTGFAGCQVAAVALTVARSAESGWLWRSTSNLQKCLSV